MTTDVRTPVGIDLTKLAQTKGLQPAASGQTAREKFLAAQKQDLRQSLSVPNPQNTMNPSNLDFDPDGGRIDLPVMDIAFYEDNPRESTNPEYENIKTSIRESLIQDPLQVTRRPGTKTYMLAYGGQTRLRIIQELWQETGDERYRVTSCIYRSWKSESHIMVKHLVENEQRGEMSFWDKAIGVSKAKEKLEQEANPPKEFGLRELERTLKGLGFPINISNLSTWLFGARNLKVLGAGLSNSAVRKIQPVFNLHTRLAKLYSIDDAVYSTVCFIPAQQDLLLALGITSGDSKAETTPVLTNDQIDQFINLATERLSEWLQIPRDGLNRMLSKLEEFPELGLSELKQFLEPSAILPPSGVTTQHSSNLESAVTQGGALHMHTPPSLTNAANETGSVVAVAQSESPKSPLTRLQTLRRDEPRLRKQMLDVVRDLAAASGLSEEYVETTRASLELNDGLIMPYGFYVELPKQSLDTFDNATERSAAWWTIATLSQQLTNSGAALMPKRSQWRRSMLGEPDGPGDSHETVVLHELGSSILSFSLIGNPNNVVAQLCIRALASYHELLPLSIELDRLEYEQANGENK